MYQKIIRISLVWNWTIKLVSFDATLLFTNMPVDCIRRDIVAHLHTERNWGQNNKERFKRPTYSLYEKQFFFFNAQLYLQKDEGAMCSPLRPFIASIFMVELEKKRITNVITVYDKLEALCRWYHSVYESWLHSICTLNLLWILPMQIFPLPMSKSKNVMTWFLS